MTAAKFHPINPGGTVISPRGMKKRTIRALLKHEGRALTKRNLAWARSGFRKAQAQSTSP